MLCCGAQVRWALAWLTIHLVDRGLVGALDDHLVDGDMSRAIGHPHHGFGDILSGQGGDALINLGCPSLIPFEAHFGELGFCEPRIQSANAHSGAAEFESQRTGDL